MSYILEALKKAERSRQPYHDPKQRWLLGTTSHAPTESNAGYRIGLLIALLANGIILGGLLLHQTGLMIWPPHTDDTATQVTPLTVRQDATSQRLVLADQPLAISEPVAINQLPTELRQRFSALNLDVHVYGERSEQRFVVINAQRYRVGDWLAEGPLLEAIVPQGVILSYGDARFWLDSL